MKKAKKNIGYTAEDLREVSDSPELTEADFAKGRPFAEVFPDLAASIRRGRGPSKAPTKKLISLRISPEVIDYFKSTGDGWQSRIDETLRKAVKQKTGKRKASAG
ncbi:BrnA antitoxin family protein [Bradyrhizobium sp. SZCCHNRI1003]|uniref:BrnA antitoxin family protein n=1 Tax=Bradyrhizobium sp. SZCCHNRI1003 TaxID=3057275 RepID=UPI0029163C8D|nr:BrnA antitoxin family protein [Bradyrhizobium sp. SZCCHNRI1003]